MVNYEVCNVVNRTTVIDVCSLRQNTRERERKGGPDKKKKRFDPKFPQSYIKKKRGYIFRRADDINFSI